MFQREINFCIKLHLLKTSLAILCINLLHAGIIKVSITHKKLGITKDIAATKVLPFLFPLCIDNNLNLNQVRFVFIYILNNQWNILCYILYIYMYLI